MKTGILALTLVASTLVITGCSSAPVSKYSVEDDQYCYTSSETTLRDRETVSSVTTVKCNDDPVQRVAVNRAGLASNCGISEFHQRIGGKIVWKKAITCQLPDGSWDIIGNLD